MQGQNGDSMKPRIAVLGCGHWGKNLVRNFHALGNLEMVCDPAEAGRALANQIAPGVSVAEKFEDALSNNQVDAIAIAAPAAMHYTLAKAALHAGKDVYVEKPLCLNENEGEELIQLADKLGKVLMVGHLLQYHPCVRALHALLASGDLGKLHYITSNRLNLGKIRREENALWSFAPHDISVIISLTGGQLPDQVRCTGGAYLNQHVADTTLTALQFPGGVRAHVFVSWLNPFKEQKLTVVGSSGLAVFDDTKPWSEKLMVYRQYITWTNGQVATPNNAKGEAVVPVESEPLMNECQHFVECCRDRHIPHTDGREGLRVLSTLQAAQRSLDTDGKAVIPVALLHSMSSKPQSVTDQSLPASSADDYFVHPTAVVDDGALIGKDTKIWHFCHVMKGAKIGERCVFGQNVNVDGGTIIGNNVKVQNNVSIYTGVEIDDDVFLGPSCVLTNVTNPRSQVNRHNLYEKTLIRRGATIGANSTLVCGITIGQYAFVAAGAVVTKDVPDYAMVLGNPARQKGWMSRHGHLLKPGQNGVLICPESGFRYQETDDNRLCCMDLDENQPLPPDLSKGVRGYDEYKYA
jgi:UDP-2-acetamido-3-amino-2,3-dideoxy-glucuronate N-acetyltransferase